MTVLTTDSSLLDQLFNKARTHNAWLDRPVDEALLQEAVRMAMLGPTSANCQPMRIIFVRTDAAKERLIATVAEGNVEKVRRAPVTAIIGHDLRFFDQMLRLFPHRDMRPAFEGKEEHARVTALRNGTLQAGYLLLALRAVGLDCGPLSGFSNEKVDAAFFPDGQVKSNFLCNIGYGDPAALFGRLPRLGFDEVCRFT